MIFRINNLISNKVVSGKFNEFLTNQLSDLIKYKAAFFILFVVDTTIKSVNRC